jgi:hypothetical protein
MIYLKNISLNNWGEEIKNFMFKKIILKDMGRDYIGKVNIKTCFI